MIIAVAAIALPLRRPELYRASPANVKFLGIPVLFIVAPLSIAIFVALAVVSTQYPALVMQGNSANFWWIPAWFAGLIVAGALLYYIPRFAPGPARHQRQLRLQGTAARVRPA